MIRQLPLPFLHAPQFACTMFLRGPSNAEALAWLERPAEWPMQRLALWGGAGSGKSHLLHHWASRQGVRVIEGANLALEPPTGPVAIDDADLAAERPLLHLLNAAAEAGFPVVTASRTPPARWAVALPDLASRLRAMLSVELRPAEDELLRSLLATLFGQRQLPVPEVIQEYLLLRLPRTPAALREAAARLDRLALASGGRITKPLAALVVAELCHEAETTSFDEDFAWPLAAISQDSIGFL